MKYYCIPLFFVVLFLFGVPEKVGAQSVSVDIIMESPDSHSPNLFEGKVFGPPQTGGVLHAITYTNGGAVVNPDTLTYVWKYNGSVVSGTSGAGQNTFSIPNLLTAGSVNIQVEIRSSFNIPLAKKTAQLTYSQPEIIFYEKDPLLGILYQNALRSNVELKKPEISVFAEPFSFNKTHQINYEWKINNKDIPDTLNNDTVVFRNESDTEGQARISASVTSAQTILHRAHESFTLLFNN